MWRLTLLALFASAAAQIPSLGWCPDYLPMADFNMKRFLGTWFEAERYFTVSELVSRCVTTKYESTPEGRILVSNEITNSLTGMKRVMDGHLNMIGREGEGRIIVKYAALPIPYDTEFSILETDYDNYAVMWSCSGIGPVHTQNAWVMTRERLAPMAVMQAAYGVLDRYKISRTFFVKTNQADCNILPDPATKEPEYKNAANVEVEQKSAIVPPVVVDQVLKPVEKVDPVVIPEVPVERSAIPVPEEAKKPMQVPEMIMDSAEKKDEKMDKPEKMPMKEEMDKKDKMPEKEKMPMKDKMQEKEKMPMKDKMQEKEKMPMKEKLQEKEKMPMKEKMQEKEKMPMKEKTPEKEKMPDEKKPEKEKMPMPEMPMMEMSESKEKEMKEKPQ